MNILKKIINKIKHHHMCKLNGYYCPDCIYHEFIFEGLTFRGNRCRYIGGATTDQEANNG